MKIAHPKVIMTIAALAVAFGIYGNIFVEQDGYMRVSIEIPLPEPHEFFGLKGEVYIWVNNTSSNNVQIKNVKVFVNDSRTNNILYFEQIDDVKLPGYQTQFFERSWSIAYIPDGVKGGLSYEFYENGQFMGLKSYSKTLNLPG